MRISTTNLDCLRRAIDSMVHIMAVCPHIYDPDSSSYTLHFNFGTLRARTSLKNQTISLVSVKGTRYGGGSLLTEDTLRMQITGFRIDESSDRGVFDNVEFYISDDPKEAQANAWLVQHFLGGLVCKPSKVAERGVGFTVRIPGGLEQSPDQLLFNWFEGKFAISTDGTIQAEAPKVRKLDHTANRRMLASIKKFLEQAQVRARLNVIDRSRVAAASDVLVTSPYPVPEDVITDLFCRYLKSEDIAPEDMDLLFALAVKEAKLTHVLRTYSDGGTGPSWAMREMDRIFNNHEFFKKLIQRLHNRAKERIRIKTGVVTFEQE